MRVRLLIASLLAVTTLAGCAGDVPTTFAYDDKRVEENLKGECREAGGSSNYCSCLWEGLQAQGVSADDVKKFEDAQGAAKSDGDIVIPDNINNVMLNCRRDPDSKGSAPAGTN